MFRHLIVLALAGVFAHLLSFVNPLAPIGIFGLGMLVALTGESVQFYPDEEQFTKQARSYGLLIMSAGVTFALNGVMVSLVLVLIAIVVICDELGWSPKVNLPRIVAGSLALLLMVGAFARMVYYHEQGSDRLLTGVVVIFMATAVGIVLTRAPIQRRQMIA